MIGLVLSVHVALAAAAAAEGEKQLDPPAIPSWYTQTFSRGEAGLNVTSMWSLKSKFRSETVTRGHKLVTIVNGDTYYAYDALTMTGIAIRRAPAALAADAPDRRVFGNEAQILIDEGGEKIRDENIGGKPAAVYQITDESGRRTVWVTPDAQQLPIRVEFFNRQTGSTRYKDYVDWAAGFPVSDAFFEPESGVQFERFEFAEYIEATLGNNPAVSVPILYQELLHGPPPR